MKISRFFRLFAALLAVLALPLAATAQPAAMERGPEIDATVDYFALIKTNHGDFAVRLFADVAPITVRSFVNLADGTREFRDVKTGERVLGRPFYDGLTFHRVISGFMIQGGCPRGDGTGDPGYKFRDEFSPTVNFDRPGLLAMANSGPSTNGSQFFITETPTPHLNQRHTIFGELLQGSNGLELVKKIASVPKSALDVPNEAVLIKELIIKRLPRGTSDADALPLVLAAKRGEEVPAAPAEAAPADEPAAEPVQ